MIIKRTLFSTGFNILSLAVFLGGCGEKSERKENEEIYTEAKSELQTIEANRTEVNDNAQVRKGEQKSSAQDPSQKIKSSSSIARIQNILSRANPDYRGQGRFHEVNGVIIGANLPNCGLRDLSPLKGLMLQELELSGNPVRELRHLKGMPLRSLFLENTRVETLRDLSDAKLIVLTLNNSPVKSLTGLEGQPLEDLYAVGTRVTEVSPLRSSNLRQLWLSESPVSDVSGLSGLPLISLTLHRTLVEDVLFVRQLPVLQRLHIGETPVEDLTPLAGVNLTRLVFTPSRIKRGMNVVRSLYGLREMGTVFDDTGRDLTSPEAFWAKYGSE